MVILIVKLIEFCVLSCGCLLLLLLQLLLSSIKVVVVIDCSWRGCYSVICVNSCCWCLVLLFEFDSVEFMFALDCWKFTSSVRMKRTWQNWIELNISWTELIRADAAVVTVDTVVELRLVLLLNLMLFTAVDTVMNLLELKWTINWATIELNWFGVKFELNRAELELNLIRNDVGLNRTH